MSPIRARYRLGQDANAGHRSVMNPMLASLLVIFFLTFSTVLTIHSLLTSAQSMLLFGNVLSVVAIAIYFPAILWETIKYRRSQLWRRIAASLAGALLGGCALVTILSLKPAPAHLDHGNTTLDLGSGPGKLLPAPPGIIDAPVNPDPKPAH